MARTLVGRLQLVVQAMGLGEAKKVESAITSIERTARRLSSAPWGQGFQRQIEKMALSAKEFDHVRTSWNRLQKDMATRGLTAALKKSEISAWKTATVGNLAAVRAQMQFTERRAQSLAKTLRGVVRPAYIMAGGYTGVYMTGVLGREAIGASAERQREYFRQRMANIPEDDRETIFKRSQDLSEKYPAVNITDIMEMARSAYSVMGDVNRAAGILPKMVQALVVAQSVQNPEAATQQVIDLIRGLDILGVNSTDADGVDRVNKIIDAAVKASQADPDFHVGDYLHFARTSKVAGLAVSDEFMTRVPAYIQDMGAGTTGNSLAMGFKSFLLEAVGSAGGKKYLEARERLGIRKHGELVEADLYGRAPDEWAIKVLKPALEKSGIDLNDNTAVAAAIGKLSGNTTATGFLTHIIEQSDQINRWLGLMDKAMGTDAAEQVRLNDPFVAWKGFQESLRNLSASVGENVMPVIVPALNSFAGTINSFAAAVQAQDPRVLGGAGILGAGAAAWGSWKVISGIWGLVTAGASLQTAATMLQAAAVAQGGGGVADVPDKITKSGGWMATLGISAIAAAAAASINLAQSNWAKTQSDIEREGREKRSLDAYFANKPAGGGWRRFLFGDAADPDFRFNDHLRMDPGGKDRASSDAPEPGAPPARSEFGTMLNAVTDAINRATAKPAGEAQQGNVSLDTGAYVTTAQDAGAQAKQALDITAAPKVDHSSIDTFLAKVHAAQAALRQLASSATNIRSNVDAEMQRAYSDYGVVP